MKKVKYAILAVFSLLLCFCLGACEWPFTKYFYDYHVVWYSDDPFIEFVGGEHNGRMILDGIEYEMGIDYLGSTIDFADFGFYNHDYNGEGDYYFWKGTAKVKDGQLFLTVVTDNVSDYAGKTIVLNQRPVDETE